jgi:hypothetical protein
MASYEELEKQIIELRRLGRWTQALPLARECCDRFHIYNRGVDLTQIVKKLYKIDDEFIDTLERRGPDSASKHFILGFVWWVTRSHAELDYAFKCFTLAAESGHVLALYLQAKLGSLWSQRYADTACLYMASAEKGCPLAMLKAGKFRLNCIDTALWYARAIKLHEPGAKSVLEAYVKKHPVDSVPFGRWKPDPCYQLLLRKVMRKALFTWLLVARRLGVSRDIAGYICSFIITRGQWK